VTVAANWANRRDIIDLATLAGGTLVAVGHSSVAFSMTAEPAAVTSFERLLTRFGILSVERSHVLTVSLADDEPAAEEPSDESADDTTEFEQIISAGMDAAGSGTPGATTP
jgi:hypothetical protein